MTEPTGATTRSLVENLLLRIGEGDPDRIAELYAETCDWKVDWPDSEHGRAGTPWIRHRSTRAEMAGLYRELGDHHVTGRGGTQVDQILVDGDEAVVLGEIRQTARPTGRDYRARFALHVGFEDGLVVRNHVYEDSLAVAQAFDEDASALSTQAR